MLKFTITPNLPTFDVNAFVHRIASEIVALPNRDEAYLEGLFCCDPNVYHQDPDTYNVSDWVDALKMILPELKSGEIKMHCIGQANSEEIGCGRGSFFEGKSEAELIGHWLFINGPQEIIDRLRGSEWDYIIRDPFVELEEWRDAQRTDEGPQDEPVDHAFNDIQTMATQDSYWN